MSDEFSDAAKQAAAEVVQRGLDHGWSASAIATNALCAACEVRDQEAEEA